MVSRSSLGDVTQLRQHYYFRLRRQALRRRTDTVCDDVRRTVAHPTMTRDDTGSDDVRDGASCGGGEVHSGTSENGRRLRRGLYRHSAIVLC